MFNVKNPDTRHCNGSTIYQGNSSYIKSVKWADFKVNYKGYVDIAVSISENKEDYEIKKELEN